MATPHRTVETLTPPLARRVRLAVRLGLLHLVRDALATQELQVAVLEGEVLDRVKHILPYGFTHHPHPGAECVVLALGGRTSNSVALVVGDRRYRLHPLEAGEVALHDDQGQKVHLKRDGIAIKSPFKVSVTAPDVVVEATTVALTATTATVTAESVALDAASLDLCGGGPAIARVGDMVSVGAGSSAGLWPIVTGSDKGRCG